MIHPLIVMAIGISLVIVLIMRFKVNAFIALMVAAVVVSLISFDAVPVNDADGNPTGEVSYQLAGDAISRVTDAFGKGCSGIAIVIAFAAIIGTCMMDSGAADRIVRAFLKLLGEKRAPWSLMGSGYVLAVPVFFDTVFYLLVPLARSFYRKTGGSYLKCILAISAGGAITHTLVPPTPGPLTMAANLGIDLGYMIIVGALVALPAALAGMFVAGIFDRMYNIPMRELSDHEEPEQLEDSQLPGLCISLTPVLLPVLMIAINTVTETVSNREIDAKAAEVAVADGTTMDAQIAERIEASAADGNKLSKNDAIKQLRADVVATHGAPGAFTTALHYTKVIGNPSLALMIATVIAIWVYVKQRKPTLEALSKLSETSLMSAGVIILITAAGISFGSMLKVAGVGQSIAAIAEDTIGDSSGMAMLFLAFGLASLLKFAQGSSTAAMIIVSGMMADIAGGTDMSFNIVYLATAIGAGSLCGSWMNDSGFWIFAKMGGLTEAEALKTWTPLLVVLGIVSMVTTVVLANVLPLSG